jgi:hypothetical protein
VDTSAAREMLGARPADTINVVGILLCDILDEQRKLNDHMRALADNMALSMTPAVMVDSAGRGPGKI